MGELMKFLTEREERCSTGKSHSHKSGELHHTHHSDDGHYQLEDFINKKFYDTRKNMLDAQRKRRKYKFMQPEYMIPRNNMI